MKVPAVMKTKSILLLLTFLTLGTLAVRADDATEPPVPVRTVAPRYPDEMRRDGTSGVVTVSCTIDEKGNVQEPKVEKSSNDAFSAPALEALKKWKFKPAKKAGTPVAIRVNIPIQFNVSDS